MNQVENREQEWYDDWSYGSNRDWSQERIGSLDDGSGDWNGFVR